MQKAALIYRNLLIAAIILASSLIVSAFIIFQAHAQTAGNASVSFVKDKFTGLFIITMSDSQGILEFRFTPQNDKLPYSGTLPSCPRSRKLDNVAFNDPADFKPPMKAKITDCQGGETEFEISPPDENGRASVKKITEEPPPPPTPPPPPPPPPPPSPSEALSEGGAAEVTYPVPDLGNCGSKEECRTYCEKVANHEKCLVYAEQHGVLSKEELDLFRKFKEIVATGSGPGGCNSEKSCEEYCNDVSKINECVEFAEKIGFMKGKELEEAKKIREAVKSGKTLPGGCRNKTACEAYCKNPEHMDECVAFAKDAGFMSPEEIEQIEKVLPLMKRGETPGACKSREECEAYCEDESHFNDCIAFAEKAGFMKPEEIEMAKKTGGKGPGGCKGRACADFCNKSENQNACFEFAKEHGLISEEDQKRAEEGLKFMQESLKDADPGVRECVEKIIGAPGLTGGEPGKGLAFGGPQIGEKMRECMESVLPAELRGQFKFEGEGFSGPGGCKSREECEAYCTSNPEACGIQIPPGGGIPSGESFVGPGGCATPEECIRYCSEPGRGEECDKFHTAPTTPYAGGAGPGGCGSVEECSAYCKAHPEECSGFVSEETPSEVRCQPGFETKRDNKGYKYCSPPSCPEGQEFITDFHGRQACSPKGVNQPTTGFPTDFKPPEGSGFPSGSSPTGGFGPSPEELQKIQEQIQQQIQQQQQQQFQQNQFPPPADFQAPAGFAPGSVLDAFLRLFR